MDNAQSDAFLKVAKDGFTALVRDPVGCFANVVIAGVKVLLPNDRRGDDLRKQLNEKGISR
jgi:hypothetical protein